MAYTLSDSELLQAIHRLVDDCFDNWDKWTYSPRGERDYTVYQIASAFNNIRSDSYRVQAREAIWKHARLSREFLKQQGKYTDF